MRLRPFKVAVITLATVLSIPRWMAGRGLARPCAPLLFDVESLKSAALTPPVVAATFHSDSCARPTHKRIAYEARVREPWSKGVAPFPRRWALRNGLVSEIPDPEVVQEFIRMTPSRAAALRVLKDELQWSITLGTLGKYVARHGLEVTWRRRRPDLQKVQELVCTTRSLAEAVELLSREIHWSIRPSSLSAFLKAHDIPAPWRKTRPQPRRDPGRVQALIGSAGSLPAAIQLLHNELDWEVSASRLCTYLKEHALRAPWQNLQRAA